MFLTGILKFHHRQSNQGKNELKVPSGILCTPEDLQMISVVLQLFSYF